MLLQVLGADYTFLLLFMAVLFVLICWLIIAIIRWFNRH